jgi:hypothetical protein
VDSPVPVAGWNLARFSCAARVLAISSILVGHSRFRASCGPRQLAHFLGVSRSAFEGQSRELCSCAP